MQYDFRKDLPYEFIEHILQSKIKYVKNITEESVLLNLPNLDLVYGSKIVYCKTKCSKLQLVDFIKTIGDFEDIYYDGFYSITFKTILDADICAISSNVNFKFTKKIIFTPLSKLKEICLKRNISVFGIHNTNIPIDYYKIVIGPFEYLSEDNSKQNKITFINTLKMALNDISPLFGMCQCANAKYFTLLFKNQTIAKEIVDVLSQIQILNNKNFKIKFAYENCLITNIPQIFNIPFVSSFIPTRVVFLLCDDVPYDFIISRFPNYLLEIKTASCKIFIKCKNLKEGVDVYQSLGGLAFEQKTIIAGYYPEFNYDVGDF